MSRTFHLFNVADIDSIDFEFLDRRRQPRSEIKKNSNSAIQQCDNFVVTFYQAGISSQPLEENVAAYLESYITHLRKDKKFLFKAALAAHKAVDFLLKEKD